MTRASVALVAFISLSTMAWAQTPRTPWGDPDLQATFTTDNSIGVPFERPKQFGTRTTLTEEEYAERASSNESQLALDELDVPESRVKKDEATGRQLDVTSVRGTDTSC